MTQQFINVDSEIARQVGLDLEVALSRALLRANPQHHDALRMLGDTLTRCGEHEEALSIDRRLIDLTPRDPIAHYNLSCSFSNLERVDEALAELAASIRLGYREYDHMLRDPDLANVRRDPRFRSLISRLKKHRARPT